MKILVIVPVKTGMFIDDTEMFCRGLEKYCGHEITRAELWFHKGEIVAKEDTYIDIDLFKGVDVIWAPYEPLIPVAIIFGKDFKIPVVGHFEIIPPGRINMDNLDKHWFENTEKPVNEINYLQYKFLGESFMKCDVKTVIGDYQKYQIERLVGRKIKDKTFIKPYPLDNEILEKYRKKDVKEKYQIASITRFAPHKRTHHIIKAMSLLKNPPKLVLISFGKDKLKLIKMAKDLGVDVDFKGVISEKEKVEIIQESMFFVHPWTCLPVGEVAYFKKLSINYDDPTIRDRLNDMAYFVENNNIPKLAEAIQYFIDNPKERKRLGEKAYKDLIEGNTETYLLEEAVKRVNETLVLASKIKVK